VICAAQWNSFGHSPSDLGQLGIVIDDQTALSRGLVRHVIKNRDHARSLPAATSHQPRFCLWPRLSIGLASCSPPRWRDHIDPRRRARRQNPKRIRRPLAIGHRQQLRSGLAKSQRGCKNGPWCCGSPEPLITTASMPLASMVRPASSKSSVCGGYPDQTFTCKPVADAGDSVASPHPSPPQNPSYSARTPFPAQTAIA